MPHWIAVNHKLFVKQFIDRGYSSIFRSSRFYFILTEKFTLQPASIYLNPTFIYDTNFCLNVVLTKIEGTNNHYILIRPGIFIFFITK